MTYQIVISIASLVISFALAYRLFKGDARNESSEMATVVSELKSIKSDTNEIKAEIKSIKEDVRKDHDEIVRHEENLKQVWKKIYEIEKK